MSAVRRYRGRVVTDIETFQEALMASGLPPVHSDRHDQREFRAGVASRDLGPLKMIELVTPEGECFRDARSSRSADEELWQIELMVRGQARVQQGPWHSRSRTGRPRSRRPRAAGSVR